MKISIRLNAVKSFIQEFIYKAFQVSRKYRPFTQSFYSTGLPLPSQATNQISCSNWVKGHPPDLDPFMTSSGVSLPALYLAWFFPLADAIYTNVYH